MGQVEGKEREGIIAGEAMMRSPEVRESREDSRNVKSG